MSKILWFIFGILKGQGHYFARLFWWHFTGLVPTFTYIFFTFYTFLIRQSNCIVVLHYETVKFQINCMSGGYFPFTKYQEKRDTFFERKIPDIFHGNNQMD